MSRLLQVVPRRGIKLFGQLVRKETELRRRRQGTFHRAGRKALQSAKWTHVRYKGWIRMERGAGEVITAEIQSRRAAPDEWQLLQAFIGFLDRHFAAGIRSISVQFPEP
jgi:hypothetical protein